MGLLAREKVKGNMYLYRITDWGIRYVEEGCFYREDEIRIKLLSYITRDNKMSEKEWAAEALAPRLLQRFFPGRRAQDIDPYVDLPEATYNASQILKQRIINETIELDDEFAIQCLDDEVILLLVDQLMSQLYPVNYTYLDVEEFKKQRRTILEESITELRNPPKRATIRGLGYDFPIKLKRRPEDDRPNRKDLEKLDKVIDKLEELINIST